MSAKTKSKKSRFNLLPLCPAALCALTAVLFVLPQFSRTALNNNTLNMNGFKLAFGFEDIVKVPGRFYFLIPFLLGLLNTAVLLMPLFVKALGKNVKPVYFTAAALAFFCAVLFIVYAAAVKRIDAGVNLVHNYYFKNIIESSNKDILRGGLTFWFWLGFVLHLLTVAGCCFGAVKKS